MLPPKIVVSDQLKMFSVDRELFWRGGGSTLEFNICKWC